MCIRDRQCPFAEPEIHIIGYLGGSIHDLVGHIAQQNRASVTDANDNLFHVFTAREQRSSVHPDLLVLV